MKILILQLARLGDIYMTWPAIRAVRRAHPGAEIHFLTRPRFEGAVEGLTAIDRHRSLSASHILEPVVHEQADLEESLSRMDSFVQELKGENFDWIINFTFSPFSSYLTHAVSNTETKVTGYTRFNDGFFHAPDEVSAYFYAQVGINKPNRVHVSDLFISMLGLEYVDSDWAAPDISTQNYSLPQNYLAVHIGASEKHKALSPKLWGKALSYVSERFPQMPVVLLGASSEQEIAREVQKLAPKIQFVDLVGRTQISDLFTILKSAELLIGPDSAPIHVASLTDTPTLNISVGQVNFWETGPKASLGFILRAETEDQLTSDRLGEVISQLLEGRISEGLIARAPGLCSFEKVETKAEQFAWNLVQAIYLSAPYPMAERIEVIQGAMKLGDINNFMMEQLALIPARGLEKVAPLLDRGEEIIQSISRLVPELSPIVNWYHAEKIRVAPGAQEEIRTATLNVHERFARHLHAYIPQEESTIEEVGDGTL